MLNVLLRISFLEFKWRNKIMVNGISSQQLQVGQVSSQTLAGVLKGSSSQPSQSIGSCNPCTGCGKCGAPQDPSTVTQEQLKSPIDIKV